MTCRVCGQRMIVFGDASDAHPCCDPAFTRAVPSVAEAVAATVQRADDDTHLAPARDVYDAVRVWMVQRGARPPGVVEVAREVWRAGGRPHAGQTWRRVQLTP
ncbi:MAG: hypothetical protein ACRCZP_17335 [Phycicoccus sp.]